MYANEWIDKTKSLDSCFVKGNRVSVWLKFDEKKEKKEESPKRHFFYIINNIFNRL